MGGHQAHFRDKAHCRKCVFKSVVNILNSIQLSILSKICSCRSLRLRLEEEYILVLLKENFGHMRAEMAKKL